MRKTEPTSAGRSLVPCQEQRHSFFGSWQTAQMSKQRIVTYLHTVTLWKVSGYLPRSCFSTAMLQRAGKKKKQIYSLFFPFSSSNIQTLTRLHTTLNNMELPTCESNLLKDTEEGNCWGRISNCSLVGHNPFTMDWYCEHIFFSS